MTYQKLNRALVGAMLLVGVAGVTSQAHALAIDPMDTGWILNTNYWTSTATNTLNKTAVEGLVGVSPLDVAYKFDFTNFNQGPAKSYYTTSLVADAQPGTTQPDYSGGTISWGGNMAIVCGDCFLVVKDGNVTPSQYFFKISSWNGTDTINLSNFWPGGGSISSVAIWNNTDATVPGGGGTIAAIPEPETYAMLLAGLGLVGFVARRKLS